tara:strand:+ start:47255 stop:47437 length:183 start_codon:yes stop_codon:yes gene_type:complete
MKLGELNERVLNTYRELIDSHGITTEEIIKSSASITASLFETEGVKSIEIDDKRLSIESL